MTILLTCLKHAQPHLQATYPYLRPTQLHLFKAKTSIPIPIFFDRTKQDHQGYPLLFTIVFLFYFFVSKQKAIGYGISGDVFFLTDDL